MKIIAEIMTVLIMISGTFTLKCLADEEEMENTVEENVPEAKAEVLMERDTGQILYGMNENERLPMASITKIMTLLILAEEIDGGRVSLDDIATASPYASSMDGSVVWLEPNEQMSLYDLTRAVVTASANDACVCIAEYISGSEEKFVERMNRTAAELGMKNTRFANCVGYDDPNHYSTAADIAVMAAELRHYDYFDEFLLTRLSYLRENTGRDTQLLNTNKLITSYKGITGLKTGTTDGAGYCFCATAKRGETELIAVVLGAKSDELRFSLAKELLDYGFEGFQLYTASFDLGELFPAEVVKGVKKSVKVMPEAVPRVILEKGSISDITYRYERAEMLEAPVKKGDIAGRIIAGSNDGDIFAVNIIAAEDVEELNFFKCFTYIFRGLF